MSGPKSQEQIRLQMPAEILGQPTASVSCAIDLRQPALTAMPSTFQRPQNPLALELVTIFRFSKGGENLESPLYQDRQDQAPPLTALGQKHGSR